MIFLPIYLNVGQSLSKFSRLEFQAIGSLLTLLSTGERESTRHSPLLGDVLGVCMRNGLIFLAVNG